MPRMFLILGIQSQKKKKEKAKFWLLRNLFSNKEDNMMLKEKYILFMAREKNMKDLMESNS